MKERVFISGVAGFLGSHLADRFLADGHEVVGIDNMLGGYPDNVPAGVSFHEVDCNDLDRVGPLVDGCQVVYHCAATAYEGLSVFSPHMVTQNIVTASTGMISAAIATRVRRFVMCSSMARYGAQRVPFTEDVLGFSRDIPSLMRVADVMVGKPGPLSIFEALASRLPVVLWDNPAFGVLFDYNLEWVEQAGVGVRIRSAGEVRPAVELVLASPQSFRDAIARVAGDGTPEIVRAITGE